MVFTLAKTPVRNRLELNDVYVFEFLVIVIASDTGALGLKLVPFEPSTINVFELSTSLFCKKSQCSLIDIASTLSISARFAGELSAIATSRNMGSGSWRFFTLNITITVRDAGFK